MNAPGNETTLKLAGLVLAIMGAGVLGAAWWPVTWWPREDVGVRLRRECTAIVRESNPELLKRTGQVWHDNPSRALLEEYINGCIQHRGLAGR